MIMYIYVTMSDILFYSVYLFFLILEEAREREEEMVRETKE